MIKIDNDTMKTALLRIIMTGTDSLSIVDRLSNSSALLALPKIFAPVQNNIWKWISFAESKKMGKYLM